jgi:hypothetical protein
VRKLECSADGEISIFADMSEKIVLLKPLTRDYVLLLLLACPHTRLVKVVCQRAYNRTSVKALSHLRGFSGAIIQRPLRGDEVVEIYG